MRFNEFRTEDEQRVDEAGPALGALARVAGAGGNALTRAGQAIAKSGLGRKAINKLAGMAGAGGIAGRLAGGGKPAAGGGVPQGLPVKRAERPDSKPDQTAAPLPVATGNMPPGPPPTTTGGVQKATAPSQQMAQPNAQADPEVAKAQKAADQQAKAQKKNLQQQIKLTKLQLQQMQKQLTGM